MSLKFYSQKADNKFWENIWNKQNITNFFEEIDNSPLMPIFLKYLSKENNILEAGCGLGQWVYSLFQKGYKIKGVDKTIKTIKKVKKIYPKVPLEYGNLFNLKFKENSFGAIICLGVLEHFENHSKSARILRNFNKVLSSKGLLFCSVPYHNPIRVLKNLLGLYSKKGSFYQYAFTKNEFKKKLEEANFKIIDIIPFDSFNGLKKELFPKIGSRLYKQFGPNNHSSKNDPSSNKKHLGRNYCKKYCFLIIKKVLNSYPSRQLFAHMLLFITQKEKG